MAPKYHPARSFPCPLCGEGAGKPCRTLGGDELYGMYHSARKRLVEVEELPLRGERRLMDKLIAADQLAEAVEALRIILPWVVTHEHEKEYMELITAQLDYQNAPAIPPLEKILEAMEWAINARYDFDSDKQKAIHLVIAELRKAVGK